MTPIDRERLESRMWNWARWLLDSPGAAQGHCGSAEGGYVTPREDQERFERSAREPINILDACKIEEAIGALRKPGIRMFLLSWYVSRSHPMAMARRFKVPVWQLVPRLWIMLGRLQWHLDHTVCKSQRNRVGSPPNLHLLPSVSRGEPAPAMGVGVWMKEHDPA